MNDEKWKENARPVIYAMAGVYLLTLAYQMFQEISYSAGTEQKLMIVFSIIFTVIGFGMVIFGITSIYRNMKKNREEDKEE